jgi:hypothetical protein
MPDGNGSLPQTKGETHAANQPMLFRLVNQRVVAPKFAEE